jgi:hypothetical protein
VIGKITAGLEAASGTSHCHRQAGMPINIACGYIIVLSTFIALGMHKIEYIQLSKI